jgi:LPXTG-motif cell wall-anchored protein
MPQRRHVARAALTAATATALLGLAAPAWATGNPHNPPGDNGTVKIDGAPFEDSVDNQPHVGCQFEIEFFNFDEGDTADITLAAQPPSGKFQVVKFFDNYVISDDPASGAENDHDAVIKLSANDLALAGVKAHDKQGYHVKLTVDLTDGKGKAKHKVFWLQPCDSTSSPTPNPSGSPSESPSPTPTPDGSENPSENPSGNPSGTPGGGAGGGTGTEGGLPLTGVAATSISLTGLALIVGGVVLMALRRRRDKITFTS